MSYQFSAGGHVKSRREEAQVLATFLEAVEATGSLGTVSFTGQYFGFVGGAPTDAVATGRELLRQYNKDADADDQVETRKVKTEADALADLGPKVETEAEAGDTPAAEAATPEKPEEDAT